ncbi:MAG: glycosyltransferase [Lentisphaerae bacterium]|nr:glycosyltransferase [Lentisphaerota bacterium]
MAAEKELSLILPVYNERECIETTVREAVEVLRGSFASFEILAMDDGSDDGTAEVLTRLADELDELRVATIVPHSGQSIALGAGVREAKGGIVVLMDADGQNDPADIPRLAAELDGHDVCFGYRAARRDRPAKILAGRAANAVRNRVLGEDVIDTGCTLKAFKSEFLRELPVWHGMHRFLGSFARMAGARISQVPVNHRPRKAGRSKYSNMGRLLVVLLDLWGVRWIGKRHRRYRVVSGQE